MRKIVTHIKEQLRADFDPVVYGGTFLMLVALAVAFYGFDALPSWTRRSSARRLPEIALFYAGPWLFVLALQRARGQITRLGPRFWKMALAAIAIITFMRWFPYYRNISDYIHPATRSWGFLIAWSLKSSVLWFVPILLFWLKVDRRDPPSIYGMTLRGFEWKPYLIALSVALPIVMWASYQPAFLQMYPYYYPGRAETVLPIWLTVPTFELLYGFDFMFVELFFRGFLVIGFARYLGSRVVLPMCAMYVVFHFGKPLPECIGSLFGGYLLGVLALRTRTIAGGVLLHVGLAWLMELAAWFQHYSAGFTIRP